ERTHRLRLAVRPGNRSAPTDAAVAFGDGESRLRAVDTDLRRHGEHVLELARMQPRTESGVITVGAVGEHRRKRNLPGRRLLDQPARQLRLRLEAERRGD